MKKIIIFFVSFLFLLSFGCIRSGDSIDQPTVIEYHKGTTGIEINTVEGMPPEKIIEGSSFSVGVELKNKGAYDVRNGKLLIYGFKGNTVALDSRKEFQIEGKKPGFPEGGYEIIDFELENKGMLNKTKTEEEFFTIQAYYDYRTEAGAEICVNPRSRYSYESSKETICKPEEVRLSGGQGAPVAVTKINPIFSKSKDRARMNFDISIENRGDGKVVGDVQIKEVRLANAPIECSQENIRLDERGEGEFSCFGEISYASEAYYSPISVVLDYGYTTKIDQEITIKKFR